jgi:hypothetical protein
VNSGHKLLQNISGKVDTPSASNDWQSLWKINAPPKAKHLLWRVCKGCVPYKKDVCLVRYHVLFVIMGMKMIGRCCSIVK